MGDLAAKNPHSALERAFTGRYSTDQPMRIDPGMAEDGTVCFDMLPAQIPGADGVRKVYDRVRVSANLTDLQITLSEVTADDDLKLLRTLPLQIGLGEPSPATEATEATEPSLKRARTTESSTTKSHSEEKDKDVDVYTVIKEYYKGPISFWLEEYGYDTAGERMDYLMQVYLRYQETGDPEPLKKLQRHTEQFHAQKLKEQEEEEAP